MRIEDARRLIGPHRLGDWPGAVIEVRLPDGATGDLAVQTWAARARQLLDALGWTGEQVVVRRFPGGASLAVSAPFDALYSATEIVEWAFDRVLSELADDPLVAAWLKDAPLNARGTGETLEKASARLGELVDIESDPVLRALAVAAREHDKTFLCDDDEVSVGMGCGSLTWSLRALPDARDVDWAHVHDVPVALVTGCRGKTTTARLLAMMTTAAGWSTGLATSEGLEVEDEILHAGDWSTSEGARLVLRDRRVELAVLETSLRALLHGGLATPRLDVALVTGCDGPGLPNYGLASPEEVAEAACAAAAVLNDGGRLVLNADDGALRSRAGCLDAAVTWFSLRPDNPLIAAHVEAGGEAFTLEDGLIVHRRGGSRQVLLPVTDVPCTLDGAAFQNVADVLAALALASALRLRPEAMREGLLAFRGDVDDNPGHVNLLRFEGVSVLVDAASDACTTEALVRTASELAAQRRRLVFGPPPALQDGHLTELARAAARLQPTSVVVAGAGANGPAPQAAVLAAALRGEGIAHDAVTLVPDELLAVREALQQCTDGDLLVIVAHRQRLAVLELLVSMRESGWTPGSRLPG